MIELYTQNGRVRGLCSVCGDTETYTYKGKGKHKNKNYPKPYYFSVFEKVSWFRGDDEYRGKICKSCLEAGEISKATKGTSERLTLARASTANLNPESEEDK